MTRGCSARQTSIVLAVLLAISLIVSVSCYRRRSDSDPQRILRETEKRSNGWTQQNLQTMQDEEERAQRRVIDDEELVQREILNDNFVVTARTVGLFNEDTGRKFIHRKEQEARQQLKAKAQVNAVIAQDTETTRLLKSVRNGDVCSICQDTFDEPGGITTALCRGLHPFHKECMDKWRESDQFRQDPRCPLCRDPIPRAAGDKVS